jgi:Holliday junction resolvase RusA-like endonuclease
MTHPYTLTIPPSTNHLYRRRGRHTFKTQAYTDWITENTLTIGKAKPHRSYPAKIHISIHGGKGWRVSRDIDNAAKACLDLMQSIGVLAEDNTQHINHLVISYIEPKSLKDEAFVTLVIY